MHDALRELKSKVASISNHTNISNKAWENFCDNCTVALMAGGESSRFRPVTGDNAVNKNSFQLPNGDTMIEMTIRMYKEAGLKNFVALVYHNAKSIEELLGDGGKYGVNIKYSYDPEKPVGKGGAVRHALETTKIPENHYLIVHNPDDVIVSYPGNFPKDIIANFLHGEEAGMLAEVVVVEETPYTYTGMKIDKSIVQSIEMYPLIPIPTHIGVSIFSPKVYPMFVDLFDYSKKTDFEKVLFPILAERESLYACSIPRECWIAVNNPKSYNELIQRLGI